MPEGTTTTVVEQSPNVDYPTVPLYGGALGVLLVAAAASVALLGPKRPGIQSAPHRSRLAPPAEQAPPAVEEDTVPGAAPRRTGPSTPPMRPVGRSLVDDSLAPYQSLDPVPEGVEPAPSLGLVTRLRQAMSRSREALQGRFDALFGKPIDEALFEELEETLLLADVGIVTATRITDRLRALSKAEDADSAILRQALRTEMASILDGVDPAFAAVRSDQPLVILVVGVNGSGKTTTIGKLAARFAADGHRVLLAAADTYRAAAVEQLKVWADRTAADFVSHDEGSDPGAVVYDALVAAKARDRNVVIIDTAGRLQTRKPLMEQLSKLCRVIQKHVPDGPHETLLVLDGTMGQNGLSQAKLFNEATPLSGVVVTKLDGTAKGGMVITIASELGLPVKFIGIGEGVDDLRPFESAAFVEALA